MNRDKKATLAIIIREVQDILRETNEPTIKLEKIQALLDSWVSANDLHPELVETLTLEEFKKRFE